MFASSARWQGSRAARLRRLIGPPLVSLGRLLLFVVVQLRERAAMALLVSCGAGLIALHPSPCPSLAWGVGMVIFGSLSLAFRAREER
jgi:hypothetical protein